VADLPGQPAMETLDRVEAFGWAVSPTTSAEVCNIAAHIA
jgi:hypothetical protein